MKTKTYTAQVKAADDGDEGTFEALVSVFGNVDHAGDRVMPGAFAKSLQRWNESGDPIPVVFSHRWDDLDAHIGKVLDAEETDDGLWVKAQLDIGDDPSAAKVHRLLKDRRIREFSFAYDVHDEAKASDGANELLELDVIEVGPTLKGMNEETQLLGAKARTVNRGEKAIVEVAGSLEEHRGRVARATSSWAREQVGDDLYWTHVEATFEQEAIVYTETWDDPLDGGTYWRIPYTLGSDGTVELGDPQEVELAATVAPKARPAGVKEGRRNSEADEARIQSLHDTAVDLGADCGTSTSSDQEEDDEAKSRANPEAGNGKGEEPVTRSPSDVRLRTEIDELDLAEV
jgi:HK97 family phage prohead protease